MLEDALPVSGAAQALQALHGRLDRCVPSADFPLLIVRLACSWACAPSIPCLQPGAPLLLDCTEYRELSLGSFMFFSLLSVYVPSHGPRTADVRFAP